MIKKLLFTLIIGLFFLFLFKTEVVNAVKNCSNNLTICNAYFKKNYSSVCCRSDSCSSPCLTTLKKWEYCYVQCCYETSCPGGAGHNFFTYRTYCLVNYYNCSFYYDKHLVVKADKQLSRTPTDLIL